MNERPILFSAPVVRAILEGRKTQTRRVVKRTKMPECDALMRRPAAFGPGTEFFMDEANPVRGGTLQCNCPYGEPGDRLWVKETFYRTCFTESSRGPGSCVYRADGATCGERGWSASIHMPRWASRLTLEVVAVRVERLQEISEDDAIAEGVQTHAQVYAHEYAKEGIAPPATLHGTVPWYRYDGEPCSAVSARHSFRTLWESINGKESWDANPWVWVIEFKEVKRVTK